MAMESPRIQGKRVSSSTVYRISEGRRETRIENHSGLDNKKLISGFIACCFCGVEGAASRQEKTENIASVS